MGGLGVSIKHSKTAEPQPNVIANTPAQNNAPQQEEDYMFNERDVNYYWQEYAGQLPKEQVAMAKRMQNMHATLLDSTTFEVTVDNEIAAKDFTDMIPSLQDYLRTRLKNKR